MQIKIGDRIHFDQAKFKQAVSTLEAHIVPFIEAVIEKYHGLGIGKFDSETLAQVVNRNLSGIKKTFEIEVSTQAGKLGKSIASAVLDPARVESLFYAFSSAVENLHQAFHNATSIPFNRPDIYLTDCLLKGSSVTVDKKTLEDRFSIYVKSEDQLTFLGLLTGLKESYDKVRAFMSERGIPAFTIITEHTGEESLCWENEDGTLFVDPANINIIS